MRLLVAWPRRRSQGADAGLLHAQAVRIRRPLACCLRMRYLLKICECVLTPLCMRRPHLLSQGVRVDTTCACAQAASSSLCTRRRW